MGDVAKGAKIFKTKCAQCHVVGAGKDSLFSSPSFTPTTVVLFFVLSSVFDGFLFDRIMTHVHKSHNHR